MAQESSMRALQSISHRPRAHHSFTQVLAWNEEVARFFIACTHECISNEEFPTYLNQDQLNKVCIIF